MKLHSMLAGAVTLALSATLFTATTAFADTSGDYTYTVSGCSATITDYTGVGGPVEIPSSFPSNEVCDYTVTAIAGSAFNRKGLTSVTIPFGVTTIGQFAFAYNAITSATVGSAVTAIGQFAFYDNALAAITIPSGVTVITQHVFDKNLLTTVTIPVGVTTIETQAFNDNLLTSISIPNTVTSIGGVAFYDNNLTSITIPASVTSIEYAAFGKNPRLESVTFLGDAPTIDAGFGNVFDVTNPALMFYVPAGNTSFGSGPTWMEYPFLVEGTVVTSSDVTAGVTSGVRSATLGLAAFGLVPFSHGEQLVDTTATLAVDDLTGAGVGWNVTLSSSALTWTASNGGPTTGNDLPASALAVTTVGEITTVAGENWVGDTAIGALGSPVKVLSTSGGNGSYSSILILTLTIPGQASVGTYAGTLTTTISTAP